VPSSTKQSSLTGDRA